MPVVSLCQGTALAVPKNVREVCRPPLAGRPFLGAPPPPGNLAALLPPRSLRHPTSKKKGEGDELQLTANQHEKCQAMDDEIDVLLDQGIHPRPSDQSSCFHPRKD